MAGDIPYSKSLTVVTLTKVRHCFLNSSKSLKWKLTQGLTKTFNTLSSDFEEIYQGESGTGELKSYKGPVRSFQKGNIIALYT